MAGRSRPKITLTLDDARDAPVGTTLYRYEVELSRQVRYQEKGRVTVVTATPPERFGDRRDEMWDAADGIEALDKVDVTEDERDHREVVLATASFAKRCEKTIEMDFDGAQRVAAPHRPAVGDRIAELERDVAFLARRAQRAGRFECHERRAWGISSNSLISLAYSVGEPKMPRDWDDYAACVRAVRSLPRHRRTREVMTALETARAEIVILWGRRRPAP